METRNGQEHRTHDLIALVGKEMQPKATQRSHNLPISFQCTINYWWEVEKWTFLSALVVAARMGRGFVKDNLPASNGILRGLALSSSHLLFSCPWTPVAGKPGTQLAGVASMPCRTEQGRGTDVTADRHVSSSVVFTWVFGLFAFGFVFTRTIQFTIEQ